MDALGLMEAVLSAIAESDALIGGFRMTRATSAISATDTTFNVESTINWGTTGKVSIDGVVYDYTGTTATTLTGITHVAAGSTVAGAIKDHAVDSAVVDVTRQWSALDLVRQSFLVNYAVEEDLTIVGRNVGVLRLPLFSDEDQYRDVIKAVAYNPRGTYYGIELALEALFGAGNAEIYEDLVNYPCTVFIKILGLAVSTIFAGKSFLLSQEWDDLDGTADGLVTSVTPITVQGVHLKSLGEDFDFTTAKPSAVTYEYWDGETPNNAYTYVGSEVEGTYVILVSSDRVEFSTNGGNTFYRMLDTQGARVTDKTHAVVSTVLRIPTAATLSAGVEDQCSVCIFDGAYEVKWGVDTDTPATFELGLYAGGAFIGTTIILNRDTYYDVDIRKNADQTVDLLVDGSVVTTVAYSLFTDATANHSIEFGLRGAPAVGMEAHFKYQSIYLNTGTDYWNIRGTAGSVATANPKRLTTGGANFITADVGKRVQISESGITNVAGGNNNGIFTIDSLVGGSPATSVELTGDVVPGASVAGASPTRVTMDQEYFVFPDDLGKDLTISGSSLGNDGTYTIDAILKSGTFENLSSAFLTGDQIRIKSNVVTVSGGAFVTEADLNIQLEPNFETEAGLDWELSDAGSFTGTAITLRDALWAASLVMEIRFTDVLSAQIMRVSELLNSLISAGPPPTYEYYPFYLCDPLGILRAYLDQITAAGVIPEYLVD